MEAPQEKVARAESPATYPTIRRRQR